MAVTVAAARGLALGLEGAVEAPHFHRQAFRTKRKIFATLDETARDINLMFTPELQEMFCTACPAAFAPVAGGWGRMGATRCDLRAVDGPTLKSALLAAHGLALPAAAPRRRRGT